MLETVIRWYGDKAIYDKVSIVGRNVPWGQSKAAFSMYMLVLIDYFDMYCKYSIICYWEPSVGYELVLCKHVKHP